ncbi:hypothetical protein OSSY52_21800 [Tepiditoga spiralis]|uniref:Uncharacterized protein n=1 Tax=Tepiditoga spiralis TaxID=2108365 RepID=A0A7G1GCA6_9BACT|nr:hypothetical protein OSSY52_21800 [Tepiditoga spiralis]
MEKQRREYFVTFCYFLEKFGNTNDTLIMYKKTYELKIDNPWLNFLFYNYYGKTDDSGEFKRCITLQESINYNKKLPRE